MVEVWVLTVVGGGVASLAVWIIRTQASSVVTNDDIDPENTPSADELAEVRDMAAEAKREAEKAQDVAESAQSEIKELSQLLVEKSNDADEPLLVRLQSRLDSIEAELKRQSRVETERAVSMGKIASALEEIDGVDADNIDMDELEDLLPDGGDPPPSPYRRE